MQIVLNYLANIIQVLHLNQITMFDILIGLDKKTKMPVGVKLNFFSIVLVFLLPGCDGSNFSRSADRIFDTSIFSRSADATFDGNEDNIYIHDSTTDGNLSKEDVLEHLEAMANNIDNPGKHPDPDIEKIYEKIDKGTDEDANISDFDSSDKSIFWLHLRILSFLCANVDDGQDPNKPYKECTRKYLLEQIEEGSAANNANKDAFRRSTMLYFNMYIFSHLVKNRSDLENYHSVHGSAEDIGRALFSLDAPQLQKSCNKFKDLLSTIIPFINTARPMEKYWGFMSQRRRALDPDIPQTTFYFHSLRKESDKLLYDYVSNNFSNDKDDNSLKYWQHNDLVFSCKLMKNLAKVHVDHSKSDYPYVIANWNHPHSRCGTGKLLTLTDPLTGLRNGEPLGDYCSHPSYKNGRVLFEDPLYKYRKVRLGLLGLVLAGNSFKHGIIDPYSRIELYFEEKLSRRMDSPYYKDRRDIFMAWRYKRSKEVCGEPKNGGDGSNSASAIGDDPCDPNTAMKDPVGSIDPSKAIDNNKFLAGGSTPNPDYNPVNPWSNIGNIGKVAKLIEMHRKLVKSVAEFEDRQIKISLQKGFYDSAEQ